MTHAGFLRALGIAGWDALEPAILAALATESPILLIGPHGSAKTLLLARLAAALGLAFRHYNASILSFDDLLGYPVPQDGRLVYLQTPATIWDAEAVLFDEVSRCRPELQNKLFPLIHERVAQGVPLTKLRHRWAAMNPPPNVEGDGDGTVTYDGAEPLDVALADRFAFVLEAPSFGQLSEADQLRVLRDGGRPAADAPERLRAAVAEARAAHADASRELRDLAAEYTRVLAAQLVAAGHPLSTRRAVTLAGNVVSLRAAQRTLWTAGDGKSPDREDAFHATARTSLPDAAWGRPVPGHVVLGAHRAAWEATMLAADAPERALLGESQPLRRIALALGASSLAPADAGGVVADAFAALERPARLVTAALLFPLLSGRSDLPATTLEAVAADYALVAKAGEARVSVRRGGHDWKRALLGTRLAALDPKRPRDAVLLNAAAVLMVEEQQFDFDVLARAWDDAEAALAAGVAATPKHAGGFARQGGARRAR